MTGDDLDKVERELGIKLPAAYRSLMTAFPIPALRGNADTEMWDSADRFIEENLSLRKGRYSVKPWPNHMFCLGVDGGGSCSAVDVRESDPRVWWADRCHLDGAGSGQGDEDIAVWAAGFEENYRHDLAENGIDPEARRSEKRPKLKARETMDG